MGMLNWRRVAEIAIPPIVVGLASAWGGSELGLSTGEKRRDAIRTQRAELVELVSIMEERCDRSIEELRDEGALPSLSKGTVRHLPERIQAALPSAP